MSNLNNIARFVRTTWLSAALVVVSAFILICSGYAGDIAIFTWHGNQRGMPLPVTSEWVAANYGYNRWNLAYTHVCFCWAFALLFVLGRRRHPGSILKILCFRQ